MSSLYISDDFETLETYFFSDAISEANRLISEKVELAWDMISSSTVPYQTSVNADGTQLTREYATEAFANWQGSAMIIVNGSGLSTDEADQDYSFNSIDVILSEDGSTDPLASVTLNLGLSVTGGRATSLTLDGFSIDAEGMHVGFDGPLTIDETLQTAAMPNARFEISYDSDPGADIVLSTIYIEGALSYDGATDTMTGTFSDFGFVNDVVGGVPAHYFYSTGLNASMEEFDALPEDSSSTDVLRALFEGTEDTVYTKTSLNQSVNFDDESNTVSASDDVYDKNGAFLPEGFENVVIEGYGDVDITGNTQDNIITGNVGNNIIDGGDGNDTFVTQGSYDTSSSIYNLDGSLTLNSEGGTDELINIEFVQFDNGIKTINDVIGPLAPTSISLDKLSVDENSPGAFVANISGFDPNNDDLTYSIVEGQGDAHMFTIINNMLHLKNDITADFEFKPELEVTLRATDTSELSINDTFIINVTNEISDDPYPKLDINFSNDGINIFNVDYYGSSDVVYANFYDSTGALYVGGGTSTYNHGSVVQKFLPNGNIDENFGDLNGAIRPMSSNSSFTGNVTAIAEINGDIYIAGNGKTSNYSTNSNFFISKLNNDGIDISYAPGGILGDGFFFIGRQGDVLDIYESQTPGHAIVVTGHEILDVDLINYSVRSFVPLERGDTLNQNAKFQTIYGSEHENGNLFIAGMGGNIEVTTSGSNEYVSFSSTDIRVAKYVDQTIGTDNKEYEGVFPYSENVAIYDPLLDINFGLDGYFDFTFTENSDEWASDVKTDDQGNLYVFGGVNFDDGNGNSVFVLKVSSEGVIDETFGDNGYTIINELREADAFILDHQDRVLMASSYKDNPNKLVLSRLNSDGSLDQTFGENGIYYQEIGSNFYDPKIAFHSTGENNNFKLAVSGYTWSNENQNDFVTLVFDYNNGFQELIEAGEGYSIIDSNLVWTNGSDITITIDTLDSPGGSVAHYTDGSKSGFNPNALIQQPTQVSFTPLSDGNMAAVWAVDIWKDLGDGTWSSTSIVNSDFDIFYRVFNPVDGTFVTDEVRITDTVASDYVESVTTNTRDGFTINYSKNYSAPLLDNFADKALLGVTGSTPSNEAAFIFGYDNGDVGFGLFTNGGYSLKHPNGGQSGSGGSTQPAVNDVIRVFFEENYNSLLENVVNYAVLDIDTFKEITNTINPYDASHIENTHLNDLTWNKLIGSSDTETYEYGYLPTNESLFMQSFQDALNNLGFNDGYSMSGDFPKNEHEYIEAITSGNLKASNNGITIETEFLPLYNDIISIYAERDGHSFSSDKVTFTASIDKWGGGDSSWLDGPSIKLYDKSVSQETITHVVTVATGTNEYRTDNSVYFIDGEVSPSLNLISGNTYEFDISAVSGHPFYLSTTQNGTKAGGSIYEEVTRTNDKLTITVSDETPDLHYFCSLHSGMGGSASIGNNYIDLLSKADTPGHKHKPDMDKGSYELRVEHDQDTDGAINIDDVMGVLSLSRGITKTTSDEHKLAADWNGDGLINIDDVMGVLSRSRGMVRDDEWRFYDKNSTTSLWDKATKTNKMDIVLEEDKDIELSAILRGDVNGSYNADQHDRADPSPAPTPNPAPLPLNNDDELMIINLDIV